MADGQQKMWGRDGRTATGERECEGDAVGDVGHGERADRTGLGFAWCEMRRDV